MLSIERLATIEDLRVRKLFRGVPIKTLEQLLRTWNVNISHLQSQTSLKLQRDNIEYVYLIISGYLAVRLESNLIKKGGSFLLGFRGPEQIVGEMEAITKESSKALITAHEHCLLIEIPTEALSRAAESDWRIYRNIAVLLMERAFQDQKRTQVIQIPVGEAQVAQTLLNFLDERGAEDGMTIKGIIWQRDIADYIGCDRTTVARRLSRLKKQGIIEYPDQGRNTASRITISNLGILNKIARIGRIKT